MSPLGDISIFDGKDLPFRITPYDGWEVGEILVDGVPVDIADNYTFTDVTENHTIHVSAIKSAVPVPERSVAALIDYLVNDTPLDVDYDIDKNGVIDGRDLILLQQMMN